ncbi:hypothetical protein DES40_2348 [Litorimonas taeanensis]|uniref:Uncharacterized protein n=1 Tax=Litorimonas taeanensis TaxID=568099 RepID=A0A420WEY6_9PROT|nr:hypothetical protein [Litorimonas taeanensis]RKQ69547.1 hypothetical protein DES40_2348 [Litorimonas taeanensis]
MERRYENLLKTILLFKLCLWVIIAFSRLLADRLVSKKPKLSQASLHFDDPYLAQDGQSENILALRYL